MTRTHQRLNLEPLEVRDLLSTCNVVRLGDFGAGGTVGEFSRGDLRFCINKANDNPGPDTIKIQVTGTINLTGPLPDLASDMEIVGPGSGLLTLRRSTGGNYRIFTVLAGATIQIHGLTIENGVVPTMANSDRGGGIYNDGVLTLSDSVVSGHRAFYGAGGIYNGGTMTILRSAVTGNEASHLTGFDIYGGGILNSSDGTLTLIDTSVSDNFVGNIDDFSRAYGGGVFNSGVLSIYSSTIASNTAGFSLEKADGGGIANMYGGVLGLLNSTVSGNSAVDDGGGIYSYSSSFDPGLTVISHSTITDNSTGIYVDGDPNHVPVYVRNTIVAGNTADVCGGLTSSDHNVIGNTNCGYGFTQTDILDVDPMLGPLADNGGPTQTHSLLSGSPAIDAGDNADAPEWDQRGPGFPRIVNGRIDIGAFEVQATRAPSFDGFAVLVTADLEADEGMTG